MNAFCNCFFICNGLSNFKMILLVALLTVVVVVLGNENEKLYVRCEISEKCSCCRENELRKKILCSKVSRQ